ncbi:MAG: hypothetical protein H7138_22785 [Myxococcales bacterium]|nr:hypothetical protein [Myxococcales bacterium]
MKKNKANLSRLALHKETIRTLGDPELVASSAGWECSVKGSGNIMCTPFDTTGPAPKPNP